jgi:hypothetical protein
LIAKRHDRWDVAVTDKTVAAAAASAIDPATIRDSYDELQTAPTVGPNPYHRNVNIKQEMNSSNGYNSSDSDVDRRHSKKRRRSSSRSDSREKLRRSSRRSDSRDRNRHDSRSRPRSRSYSRTRSRSSYYRR